MKEKDSLLQKSLNVLEALWKIPYRWKDEWNRWGYDHREGEGYTPFLNYFSKAKRFQYDPYYENHDQAGIGMQETIITDGNFCPMPHDKVILDVGAGNGDLMKYLSQDESNTIIGMDIGLLGQERFWQEKRYKYSTLLYLDVSNDKFPFPDGVFDLCFMTEIIEHLGNPCHTLMEIKRVLKEGGELVMSFPEMEDQRGYWGGDHCFPKNTKIITEKGLKSIAEIQKEELVWTHKGRYMPVLKTSKRKFNGNLLDISLSNGYNFKCTPEHPLLIIRNRRKDNNITYKLKKFIMRGDKIFPPEHHIPNYNGNATQRGKHHLPIKMEWMKAEDVKWMDLMCLPIDKTIKDIKYLDITDYVKNSELSNLRIKKETRVLLDSPKTHREVSKILNVPRTTIISWRRGQYCRDTLKIDKNNIIDNNSSYSISKKILIDNNFLRLSGYFLSEGCAYIGKNNGCKQLIFYFHCDEKEYIDDVKMLIKKIFNVNVSLNNSKTSKCTQIRICNKIITTFFKNLFESTTAKYKKIPDIFLHLSKEKQRHLLLGLFKGDGYYGKEQINYYTTSKILSKQIQFILLRLGIISSLSIKISKPSKKVKKESTCYVLSICGKSCERLYKLFKLKSKYKSAHNKNGNTAIIKDNFLFTPIKKITKDKDAITDVYNLEVKSDNSYSLDCGSVHNCFVYPGLFTRKHFRRFMIQLFFKQKKYVENGGTGKYIFENIKEGFISPYAIAKGDWQANLVYKDIRNKDEDMDEHWKDYTKEEIKAMSDQGKT